jgi:hypothetical protein
MTTQSHPEDKVIARSVMLRERLATAADRLEGLATELIEEVRLLRQEVGPGRDGEPDDDSRP